MKSRFGFATCLSISCALVFNQSLLSAATHYVNAKSLNPAWPYMSWETAAAVIQQAVDSADPGDEVLVTNGVYRTGGAEVLSVMNRVALTKPVTVRSLNGPAVTVIEGYPVIGDSAVRCAYLGDGAVLTGFTLTNGATRDFIFFPQSNYGRVWGGGVWCEYASAVVSNCVISGNGSKYLGGGAHGGVLIDCALSGNSGWYGGAACSNTLVRCSLAGNSAYLGGGANSCVLSNCVLSANSSTSGGGAAESTLYNCALLENRADGSGGGAVNSVLIHCTLTGNRASGDGGGASASLLTNCIAYYDDAPAGPNVSGSTLETCCTLPAPRSGSGNFADAPRLVDGYHLAADSPCRGRADAAYTSGVDVDGEAWLSPASVGADEYHAGGTSGPLSISVRAAFTNFAANFSVAFSAAIVGRPSANAWDFGDGTVVTNAPYISHAWSSPGSYTVTATAFNDTFPAGVSATLMVQVAQGDYYVNVSSAAPLAPYNSWATAATNIQEAVDVASIGATIWVSNGVYQAGGRVVQNGITNRLAVVQVATVRSVNGPAVTTIAGYQVPNALYGPESVRCVYLRNGAVLSGFTVVNGGTADPSAEPPAALGSGGGVWCQSTSALVTNCVIKNNRGGPGGGAESGTFRNCRFEGNTGFNGGAADNGVLEDCLLAGNFAVYYGGGAAYCTLNNCTLASNVSSNNGGGVFSSRLINCIVYDNQPENYYYNCSFNFSCTTPLPDGGSGNLTNAPLFVDPSSGNFRLQEDSPCINTGSAAGAPHGLDLDFAPRIVDGAVDMGAYEFPVGSPIQFVTADCRFSPTGMFQLSFTGAANGAYDIWASVNLQQWTWIGQASTVSPGLFGFTDGTATNSPIRYYRATSRSY